MYGVIFIPYLFSVGAIYNDLFSVTFRVFQSGYKPVPGSRGMYELASRPFPFGLDYEWQDASNELEFCECTEYLGWRIDAHRRDSNHPLHTRS
jgi:hypothetical protein